MAGTDLVPFRMPWHSTDQYILLPDGTVRRPLDTEDWMFWTTWGRSLLGWWQIHETFHDGRRISTVFLGLDHDQGIGWDWSGGWDAEPGKPVGYRPLIYETMVFPYARRFGKAHDVQLRARTPEDAKRNHAEVVALVAGKGAFVCPDCFAVSRNDADRSNRYCGACHEFKPDSRQPRTPDHET